MGNLQNLIALVLAVAGCSFQAGVVKYSAEYGGNSKKLFNLWKTALFCVLCASLLTTLALIAFAEPFSLAFLTHGKYRGMILALAVTLPLLGLHSLNMSVLNGTGRIAQFFLLETVFPLFSLAFVGLLAWRWHLQGALYGMVARNAVFFAFSVVALWFFVKPTRKVLQGRFEARAVKSLSKYILMAAAATLSTHITAYAIRNAITSRYGLIEAGIWQGMWKISELYLLAVTTTLTVYFIPRLASRTDPAAIKTEVIGLFKRLMPFVLLLVLAMYFLRNVIITAMFSESFRPMHLLFKYQLPADFLNIALWILSCVLIAKSYYKTFIFIEVAGNGAYILFSWAFLGRFGSQGAPLAYLVSNLLFLVYLALFFRKLLWGKTPALPRS